MLTTKKLKHAALTLSFTPVMAKMQRVSSTHLSEVILLVAVSEVFSNKVLSELAFSKTKYTIYNIVF